MDEFKKKAFYEKFPFLGNEEFSFDPDYIRVRRIDRALLETVPKTYFHNGSLGKTNCGNKIYLILKGGEIEGTVVSAGCRSSNYAGHPRQEWDGERVIDYIYRKEINPSDIEAIVLLEWEYDNWEGSELVKNQMGIVLYLPKEDIGKVIADLERRADAEVRNEIESC